MCRALESQNHQMLEPALRALCFSRCGDRMELQQEDTWVKPQHSALWILGKLFFSFPPSDSSLISPL